MTTQMALIERRTSNRTFINAKMLLTATVVATIFFCDLTLAQNPYGLKRPSFCSTCFSNDQSGNYYCCFYFFRCCAESRLGSNNRKVTTPNPDYPDFQTKQEQQKLNTPISTPPGDTVYKEGTPQNQEPDDSKKSDVASVAAPSGDTVYKEGTPQNQEPDDSKKSDVAGVAAPPSDDGVTRFITDGQQEFAGVPTITEDVTPRYVDGSELSRGYSDTRRIPERSYSTAFSGRRYPYNVPRVYPTQQPPRNTQRRTPQNWNSNPVRSSTRYRETFQDSTGSRFRQSGRPGGQVNSDEVLWSRMEPVKENVQ